MAVYHYTIHAYRSWRPDNPRGYVHHSRGLLPPDPLMANWYDAAATQDAVVFDDRIQRILLSTSHEVCVNRGWRLHAGGTDPTHLHLLVSWRGFVPCSDVLTRLKNVMSLRLGQTVGPAGRRWFVRRGSTRRVLTRGHFRHLVCTYLPDHRGAFWREGLPKFDALGG
jgi:REP element-mobilizing transposase RayT